MLHAKKVRPIFVLISGYSDEFQENPAAKQIFSDLHSDEHQMFTFDQLFPINEARYFKSMKLSRGRYRLLESNQPYVNTVAQRIICKEEIMLKVQRKVFGYLIDADIRNISEHDWRVICYPQDFKLARDLR